MPKRPLFNFHGSETERAFYDKLVKEAIEIYGVNVYYLPRTEVATNEIFGEDPESQFNKAALIVVYVQNTTGFDGDGDFISQLGFNIDEQINIQISKTEFDEVMSLESIDRNRPLEGDLVYLPFSGGMFRVAFVDDEQPFYQLGTSNKYNLKLELFHYSQEQFNTGISEIDDSVSSAEFMSTITLGAGSGDYTVDEYVYQGVDLDNATFKAIVVSWDMTNTLVVKRVYGSWSQGSNLIGDDSSATYIMSNIDNQNIFGDNVEIETDADGHLNFDESNPFGDV